MPSSGSTASKNSGAGSPPHEACHIALCPATQRLRAMVSGVVFPTSRALIQSQCSTHE